MIFVMLLLFMICIEYNPVSSLLDLSSAWKRSMEDETNIRDLSSCIAIFQLYDVIGSY